VCGGPLLVRGRVPERGRAARARGGGASGRGRPARRLPRRGRCARQDDLGRLFDGLGAARGPGAHERGPRRGDRAPRRLGARRPEPRRGRGRLGTALPSCTPAGRGGGAPGGAVGHEGARAGGARKALRGEGGNARALATMGKDEGRAARDPRRATLHQPRDGRGSWWKTFEQSGSKKLRLASQPCRMTRVEPACALVSPRTGDAAQRRRVAGRRRCEPDEGFSRASPGSPRSPREILNVRFVANDQLRELRPSEKVTREDLLVRVAGTRSAHVEQSRGLRS
jgi:hypothetical protein